MKFKKQLFGFALTAIAAGALVSCSNEVKDPADNGDNGVAPKALNLLKSPDVVVWSGSENLGSTFGATKGSWTDENGKQYYVHNEEVEVNLSLLDANGSKYEDGISDLVSKLSIHVRTATDVTVFIPMDAKYVIESDDLYIFHEHYVKNDQGEYEYQGVYGATDAEDSDESFLGIDGSSSLTYTVEDYEVILTVQVSVDGITVTTNGITEEVIDACMERNKDGLNFEIYNYYQTAQVSWEDNNGDPSAHNIVTGILSEDDRDAVKDALDDATIEFTTAPKYYINAFGWEWEASDNTNDKDWETGVATEGKNPNDCTVEPVNASYEKVDGQIEHLNGTPYNDVYVLIGQMADHAHGGEYDENDASVANPVLPVPGDSQETD